MHEYVGLNNQILIPNNVTLIGENAFYNHESLISVEIPDSVTSIGYQAFYYCSNLTSVVIGNGVTSIGGRAFSDCYGLTSVVIGDGVTSIGSSAFGSCSIASVVIPNSVTSIGSMAFINCYKLVEVINKSSNITVLKGDLSNGYVGYYALSVSNCDDSYVSRVSNDNGYIIYAEGEEKILGGYVGSERLLR